MGNPEGGGATPLVNYKSCFFPLSPDPQILWPVLTVLEEAYISKLIFTLLPCCQAFSANKSYKFTFFIFTFSSCFHKKVQFLKKIKFLCFFVFFCVFETAAKGISVISIFSKSGFTPNRST